MPTSKALFTGLALAVAASLPAALAVNEFVGDETAGVRVPSVEAPALATLGTGLEVTLERPELLQPAPPLVRGVTEPDAPAGHGRMPASEIRLHAPMLIQPAPPIVRGVRPPSRITPVARLEEGVRTPSLARDGSV